MPRAGPLLLVVANQRWPHHRLFDAMRHRCPRRWRVVRRNFLESVDPGNAEHAGFLIDGELVTLGRVDLFSVKESDDEHDAVLSSERGLGLNPMVEFIDCRTQALTARKRWMTSTYRLFNGHGVRAPGTRG
jgi:hypothetical protein